MATKRIHVLHYRIALVFAVCGLGVAGESQASLIAHWRLNETSSADPIVEEFGSTDGDNGSINDPKLGQTYTATTVNQPSVIGIGGSYFFDNSKQNVVGTNLTGVIPAASDFSQFMWIRTSDATTPSHYLFNNYELTEAGRTGLNVNGGNLSYFADGTTINMTGGSVADGKWHHVGVTRTGNTFRLWLDGTVTATQTASANIGTSREWIIGRRQEDELRSYTGYVDDVRVYGNALSSSEINALYNRRLAAHYQLNETAGTAVVDVSGFQVNGARLGGTTINQPGVDGAAYQFDGVNDKINLNTTGLLPTNASDDFSVFMWINTTQITTPTVGAYLFGNYVSGEEGRFAIQILDGKLGYFRNSSIHTSSVTINDGLWHHVGLSRESGNYFLWVDALKIDIANVSGVLDQDQNFYLGGRAEDNFRNFAGLMDDVRIFRYALSQSEVLQLQLYEIPEPRSVMLLTCGVLVLLFVQRRNSANRVR